MLIEQQIKQYRTLNKWFNSPLGHFVAHEFMVALESSQELLRGETLLQLGNCGDNPWLKKLDYKHQWITSPFALSTKIQIESGLSQLPLHRNSIDCVIAPLSLEPFGGSLSLIDEIDRVLKPMGLIVLLCINPWSLWGGALKCGLLHCYRDRHVKMRSSLNVNRVFIQRGYRQLSLNNFCYLPPVTKTSAIKRLTFLDEIGKMIWPLPSGFYCYIAQKHQFIEPNMLLKTIKARPLDDYQSLQPVTLAHQK